MPGRTMGHVIFGNASDGPKALNAAFAMQSAMQGATIALLFPIQTAIAVRLLSKKKEEEEPPWYLGVWNDIGRFLVGGIHKTYTESEAGPFFNDVTKLVRCLHCAALTVDQFMGASNEEKFRYMCMLAVSSRDFDPSESDSIKTPTDCIAKDSKGHYLYSWDDVKQTLGIAGIDPARQSVHDAITSKTFHDLIESCGGAATPL